MNFRFFKVSFNSFSRQTRFISRIIKAKSYTPPPSFVALLKIGEPLILILILVALSLIHTLSF